MTDLTGETTPAADAKVDPDGYSVEELRPKDLALAILLTMFHGSADQHEDGAIGLTLQSSGVTLSGIAISRVAWEKATVESLRASGYEHADVLEQLFGELEETTAIEWERRVEAGLVGGRRNFIHLRDVSIVGTDVKLALWRGTLEDITGWSLGSWNPSGSAGPTA